MLMKLILQGSVLLDLLLYYISYTNRINADETDSSRICFIGICPICIIITESITLN